MEIKIGTFVRYKALTDCIGIIVCLGETMHKVTWLDADPITEWVPIYSLEEMKREKYDV